MARIRTIKPEFFTSLTIADLTPEQRLTFIGLWTHVDDSGRCVDDPRLIKAAVWPLDDRTAKDVEVDLGVLSECSLITRYILNQKRFLAVTSWTEHQRINRPSPSKIPPPEQGEPVHPEPPTRGNGGSPTSHGVFSEDSNGDGDSAPEWARNAPGGALSEQAATSAQENPETAGEASSNTALTSDDSALVGDSLSAHARLTEDSLPERNREQGTGKGAGSGEGAGGVRMDAAYSGEATGRPGGQNSLSDSGDASPAPPTELRPDVERICKHLAEALERTGSKRPRINKAWRDSARLLVDNDGITPDQAVAAIDWALADNFWQAHILSPKKLRSKYETLRRQAAAKQRTASSRGGARSEIPSFEDYESGNVQVDL